LWLVINVPFVSYFSYTIYTQNTCVIQSREAGEFWDSEVRRRRDRAEKYRSGLAKGLPKWQLPVFISTPDKEITEAHEAITAAYDSGRSCRASKERASIFLAGVPAVSLAAAFGFLWVVAGFRREQENTEHQDVK